MATHSSILAWRIPWTEGPGKLQSIGSQTVGHNWSNLAHTGLWGFPVDSAVKNPPAVRSRKGAGFFLGSGRFLGGEDGNPLQYFCLESPMDRGAWWATVHRVVKSWIWWRQLSRQAGRQALVYFWALSSVPLIHMCVFVPVPHCFDYFSFVVLSEFWKGYMSCFVLFPQNCFDSWVFYDSI